MGSVLPHLLEVLRLCAADRLTSVLPGESYLPRDDMSKTEPAHTLSMRAASALSFHGLLWAAFSIGSQHNVIVSLWATGDDTLGPMRLLLSITFVMICFLSLTAHPLFHANLRSRAWEILTDWLHGWDRRAVGGCMDEC